MTSDPDAPRGRPARVTLALPDGALRRRILEVLQGTPVEVEILDLTPGDDLVADVQDAGGDVVLVSPDQAEQTDLEALGELARDDDAAGVVVVGEDDPGTRARLLAAGMGSVPDDQPGEALAASLEALAQAEASGGIGGPEVGGSRAEPRLADFLTRSPRMRAFVQLVERVIHADTSLLLTGPTGVGKEHLARAIHAEGPRRAAPFVDVNCAALPEQLLESELFGHRKGAFTGADKDREGVFERADGGTLFLDEIGEMPRHLQVKLLTALQRHEVTPLGSGSTVRVDVRVIAATNRNLDRDVAEGRFREDLYYRLSVVPLELPALADHPEDIPELVGRFIQHFREAMPVSQVEGISDAAIEALMVHPWPGNVRELLNVVERAMLLGAGPAIQLADLPPEIAERDPAARRAAADPDSDSEDAVPSEWLTLQIKQVREAAVRRAERAYLRALLREENGVLAEVSDRAGLSARALYAKMKRYDLKKEDFRR